VLHFCHITNLTGQIFPVADICRMARARGIQTIVDGAHAYGHFPFALSDLECDYYGTSLHKWLLAPIGTGFLYVRKEKIRKLWPLMAPSESELDNIRKFEQIGTHPAANRTAIAEAMTFHHTIGVERKAARLRFLRERWSRRLEQLKGVKTLTSYDPEQSCGIGNLSVEGMDPGKLTSHLWQDHRTLVTPIRVEGQYTGIRVTPNVYTTLEEIDTFSEAVEQAVKKGV
jgi:selenocysteine lyase/cysteine desulfurase